MRKRFISALFVFTSLAGFAQTSAKQRPNIVIITVDDMGYFDPSCMHRGLASYQTPNIDRIAQNGMIVSDYYAQACSTAGRAALLTGQYPIRTGLTSVGQPGSKVGLKTEDPTLAILLKNEGYDTALFGKWHLGDRNEYLPTNHGFDVFYGMMYHLNMMEMPEQAEFPKDPNYPGRPRNMIYSTSTEKDSGKKDKRWGEVGKQEIKDMGPLTSKRMETIDEEFLEYSEKWIEEKARKDKPFFLWFNPTRMHQTTHVSEKWRGTSGQSVYADGVVQLDWVVGELLNKLEELKIMENTIILFTADNGVNLSHWPDGGTAGFRGEKGTTWDGGFRVPMLVQWKGHIKESSYTGEFMTSEDWLPTLMAAVGNTNIKEELKKGMKIGDREYRVHIDGYNQLGMLTKGEPTQRHEFFYFAENNMNAVRVDQWKVHTAVKNGWLESATKMDGGLLVNIKLDPFERSVDTPGHFLWMKEKTYIAPMIIPYITEFKKSMKEFPPRQKGSGVGVQRIQ